MEREKSRRHRLRMHFCHLHLKPWMPPEVASCALKVHVLFKDKDCTTAASDWPVCTERLSRTADQIQLQPGLSKHAEGQKYATAGVFRPTVSRRRPSSCTISPVCLRWNAATDDNSSPERQGIIWKRVAKSTRRLLVIPPPLWALWILCGFNASKTVSGCGMLALIKHLGARVFRVRSRRLKEITYRDQTVGGLFPFWCHRVLGLRTLGPLQSREEAGPDPGTTCSTTTRDLQVERSPPRPPSTFFPRSYPSSTQALS